METLFWQPEMLTDPPEYQSNLSLNFINTVQDGKYLSLKNYHIFLERDWAFSQKLPLDSSPRPLLHPAPFCKPNEPFSYRRSSCSSGRLYSSQHSNPTFGFKIKTWPHKINPHSKYRIRPLNPHAGIRHLI